MSDSSQTGAIGDFSIGVSPIGGAAPTLTPSPFAPALADLVLDAWERIQIRPAALTATHMHSALMSSQLLLVDWSVKPDGPNLWKIQLFSTTLVEGQTTYPVPDDVVAILDYYIRELDIGTPQSVPPVFTTQAGSTTVVVQDPQTGVIPGGFVSITIPVSVDGMILFGFYQVTSVLDANSFTIESGVPALNGLTGGAVPVFTTLEGSTAINVQLDNHGLAAGQNFMVQVPTAVGGLVVSGVYQVVARGDANNFTIAAPFAAGSSATAAENAGNALISTQVVNQQPIDYVITPISRTDYAVQPNKAQQARPTTVWWNRQIHSTVTLWPVPDQNGPYVLFYYAMVQIDGALVAGGANLDIPYRFLEAFTAGLAAKLARKYPPPPPNTIADLLTEAQLAWAAASEQDVERAPLYIAPTLSGYFR